MLHILRTLSNTAAPQPTALAQSISGLFPKYGARNKLLGSGALLLALQSGLAMAQTAPVAAAAPVVAADNMEAVIVTGTRRSGLKAIDSASPIQVLDAGSLERTGQPDLIQAMAQNVPSFTAQAVGGDTANLTLSARLRGLSPNDTLVLVNGKRRHTTSNLAVLGGPYQGGAAADLNFIPVAAIERIEVLTDGAAAQYGTDAIAGVVNIILKKDSQGGSFSTSYGGYYDGGGKTPDASFNIGFAPTDNSFINLTAETKFHSHSNRGATDPRLLNAADLAASPALAAMPKDSNKISGDAAYHLSIIAANAGIDLGGGTNIYGNATYGKKTADAYENTRLPSRVPEVYPNGFNPRETIDETDFGLTAGIKGEAAGWNWDLSTTYGQDKAKIGVTDTVNASLFYDTGASPLNFYAGKFIATQSTTNFDASHEYDIGWASPLNVAGGLEYRKDTYEIGAGDPGSRYKEGSQSYAGFLLTDAGKHSRNNKSIYIDLAASPIKALKLDLAARYENYSDFGSARVGKITGRYDFAPEVALRGTLSNGFRAPTMAEQYYSSTNVSPSSAYVQLAPNSAAARLVGVNGLKPEKSTNYSLGLVLHPEAKTTITLDAYVINIRDRIVGSGALNGSGFDVNSAAVVAAIIANGNVLDPTVSETGINIFSNAVNTQTKGLEAVYSYASNFAEMGKVDWSVTGNYNKTEVTSINQAPAQLAPQTLLDAKAISDLETAAPKFRLNFGALWRIGAWTINARESVYGPSSEMDTKNSIDYYETKIKTTALTDLEVGYKWSKAITFTVGANNLFNQYPDHGNATLQAIRVAAKDNAAVSSNYPSFSPFGINGGYYYAKMNYAF